ncbi:hypothetical protein [Methylococcus sp. EFPC2]|uniref:hypothetical protein n=1 Tax=Methylococcus sp. EFPC2 TaxID=2812648 RepID=UPI001967E689|nr:hypothetical protein [Methylococcus sp. EFPC2]QSA97054.1 hypothetical protein JWZ97_17935 [Methylococcus sp. EFPC2]
MSIRTARIAILALGLTACSHDLHTMKMEEALANYGAAIRWGSFERAADFQSVRRALDSKSLQDIHISSYDPIYRKELDEGDRAEQIVEIRYYREDEGVEKSVTDRQAWRYDREKQQWFLESDLPKFP